MLSLSDNNQANVVEAVSFFLSINTGTIKF